MLTAHVRESSIVYFRPHAVRSFTGMGRITGMDFYIWLLVLFMYSIRTEWLKLATERDLVEKYSVWVPKKLKPYGGVPGVATGAHITAWVNAEVLFIRLLIDKHLNIHYRFTI